MSQSDDFFNATPPIKNSNAVKCMFAVLANHTSQELDLSTYLRNLEGDQILWLQADGAKVYYVLAMGSGTISEIAVGNGPTVCWPIPDGVTVPNKVIAGREVATGIATFVTYKTLQYMTGATGVTAYLRGYRTVPVGRDSQELKAPYA